MKGIIAHYAMFDKKKREVLRAVNEKKIFRDIDSDL
jgi:hypothetical protein